MKIKVINNGNVTVSGIKVIDELTGDKWTVKELAPGQTSETFRTSYTVTEKDVLAGTVKKQKQQLKEKQKLILE